MIILTEKGKTMDDYIKREDAVRRIAVLIAAEAESDGYEDQPMENYIEYASEDLADIPSADVAPVVRCKDCVYYQDNNDGYPHDGCRWRSDETPDATDFCSFGEKKDEEGRQ